MTYTWSIHYSRWIIDDGEPEREIGERFSWPVVAFGSGDRLTQAAARVPKAVGADDYRYDATRCPTTFSN
jgi:hypothetical protein